MRVVVGDIIGREKCPNPFVLAAEQIRVVVEPAEVVVRDHGLKFTWQAAIVEHWYTKPLAHLTRGKLRQGETCNSHIEQTVRRDLEFCGRSLAVPLVAVVCDDPLLNICPFHASPPFEPKRF